MYKNKELIKVWESDTQHSVNGLSFKFTKWEREG